MTGLRAHGNKRDASEGPIVDLLRKAGCTVVLLDKPTDLLVGYRGTITALCEVKTGKRGKLTPDQKEFIASWRGSPVVILRSVDDAFNILKVWSAHPSTSARAAA
jgi:hypothetical protein